MSDHGQDPYAGGELPGREADPYVDYGAYGGPPQPAGGPPQDVLAGFWIRFAGAFLDGILIGLVTTALLFPFLEGSSRQLVQLIVAAAYFIYFHSTKAGQTPGMRICNIRVCDAAAGGRVEPGAAAVRWLMSYISGIPFALGYLWMLWDDRNQTWHDKVANTVVVKADRVPPPTESLFDR